jgi:DNA-binding CsgD family transcriptional regulator
VSLGRETGLHRAISYGLHYLGLVARARGDPRAAAAQLREALDLYRRAGDREGTAGALEGLAGLALDCGQPEPAARLFGAAERLREVIGAPLPPVSRAEYERDLAALRGGLPAEARAAAWEAGRAMSAERAAEEAMAFAPPAPGARAGATAGPSASPLSPREREVAGLVARGLMNREIAAGLVIAERTVETHVANILGKLGLKSRAEVGAWAERHGLLDGPSG